MNPRVCEWYLDSILECGSSTRVQFYASLTSLVLREWCGCEASSKYDVVLAFQPVVRDVPCTFLRARRETIRSISGTALQFELSVPGRIGIASKLSELVPDV